MVATARNVRRSDRARAKRSSWQLPTRPRHCQSRRTSSTTAPLTRSAAPSFHFHHYAALRQSTPHPAGCPHTATGSVDFCCSKGSLHRWSGCVPRNARPHAQRSIRNKGLVAANSCGFGCWAALRHAQRFRSHSWRKRLEHTLRRDALRLRTAWLSAKLPGGRRSFAVCLSRADSEG